MIIRKGGENDISMLQRVWVMQDQGNQDPTDLKLCHISVEKN